MQDSVIIPLQQLYLQCLAAMLKSEKLDCVIQDMGEDRGRLWVVSEGTTVPQAWIAFVFNTDDVGFKVAHRDERALDQIVKYAEGLDGFLERLQKFLRANRLAAPKSTRAARASLQ